MSFGVLDYQAAAVGVAIQAKFYIFILQLVGETRHNGPTLILLGLFFLLDFLADSLFLFKEYFYEWYFMQTS